MWSRSDRTKHLIVDSNLLGNFTNRNNNKQAETPYQNKSTYGSIQTSTQRHGVACAIQHRNKIMTTSTKAAAVRTEVPETSATAIREWVSLESRTKGAFPKAVNQMHKDGIRSTDCFSPRRKDNGHTCTQELYDSLLFTVQMGMEKEKQAILQKNPKDLESEVEKNTRNDCVKERGSLLKDFRVAPDNRENTNEGTPKNPTRTAIQHAEGEMHRERSRGRDVDREHGGMPP